MAANSDTRYKPLPEHLGTKGDVPHRHRHSHKGPAVGPRDKWHPQNGTTHVHPLPQESSGQGHHPHPLHQFTNTHYHAHTKGGSDEGNILPALEVPAARWWIFQANSKNYRLREALAVYEASDWSWTVTRYRQDIRIGDFVYVWESGKDACILAIAEVTSVPYLSDGRDDDRFWIAKPWSGSRWVVDLTILDRLAQPILKADLLAHPILRNLQIIRSSQGTNFPVTPGEVIAVNELLSDTPLINYFGARRNESLESDRTAPRSTDAYYYERGPAKVEVLRLHNDLSNSFVVWLRRNGYSDVVAEKNCVDIDFKKGNHLWRAELKICRYGTRHAIREALGQLLEYNYFGGRDRADKWLIVLNAEPSDDDVKYVSRLRKATKLPVHLGWRDVTNKHVFVDGNP